MFLCINPYLKGFGACFLFWWIRILGIPYGDHCFKKMREVFARCHFMLAIGVRGTLHGSFVGSQKLPGFSIFLAEAEGKIKVT